MFLGRIALLFTHKNLQIFTDALAGRGGLNNVINKSTRCSYYLLNRDKSGSIVFSDYLLLKKPARPARDRRNFKKHICIIPMNGLLNVCSYMASSVNSYKEMDKRPSQIRPDQQTK